MNRMNDYRSRPPSEQLSDLHVYIVPPEIWRGRFNNVLNHDIPDTVSAGFLRVHPEMKIYSLRDEIDQQLGSDLTPREYVFLKLVGRSLTRVKPKQEYQLKVKHFLPPLSESPEIYILETTPEIQAAFGMSSDESTRSHTQNSTNPNLDSPRTGQSQYGQDKYENYSNYKNNTRNHPNAIASNATQTSDNDMRRNNFGHYQNSNNRAQTPLFSQLPKLDSSSPSVSRESTPTPYNSHRPPPAHTVSFKPEIEPIVSYRNTQEPVAKSKLMSPPPELSHANYKSHPPFLRPLHPPDPEISPTHVQSGYPRSPQKESPHSRTPNGDYLPPLSATPPTSADKNTVGQGKRHGKGPYSQRSATNTTNTNEDSGIAGFTPEQSERENYDDMIERRRLAEEARQREYNELQRRLQHEREEHERLDDLEQQRLLMIDDDLQRENDERWNKETDERRQREKEDSDRRRQEEADERRQREKEDSDRRRQDELDELRRQQDEERRLAQERLEAERRQLEEEKRKLQEKLDAEQKSESDEDLSHFPSPPPLRISSPDRGRDTESARRRRHQEKDKLLVNLEEAKETRKAIERQREDLVKRAKQMQNKTQNRRNNARDLWKKRYFEEKKKTAPLDDQCNKFRQELELLHRKLMSTLEGPKLKTARLNDSRPSMQNNYKLQATKLQHEMEDLRRRVENAKMKLTAEMKLRNQAETELRALRAELTQKKINLSLTRSQQLAALNTSPETMYSPRAIPAATPR